MYIYAYIIHIMSPERLAHRRPIPTPPLRKNNVGPSCPLPLPRGVWWGRVG